MIGAEAMEHAEIREMAREIARRELVPRAVALGAGQSAALEACWRILAAAGLDRALLAEECGGAGLGIGELLTVVEELATGDGGMALCVLLCNAALAMLPGERAASIPEGARWALVPATAGRGVLVSDSGLAGRIACALGAHRADGLVVVVPGAEAAVVPVATGTPGLSIERDGSQMGLRSAPAASVILAGVDRGPAAAADDDPGASNGCADAVAGVLGLLRAGTASIARGVARRAYEMARDYAHQRLQGGVKIVAHDAVTDLIAAMTVELAFPLPLVARSTQALALKIAATDAAVRITTDAVQVFGGVGYMHETGVEKLMRDAKYCQLFPEPNWVARDELVHLQHAPDLDLSGWPASLARVRAPT